MNVNENVLLNKIIMIICRIPAVPRIFSKLKMHLLEVLPLLSICHSDCLA